METVKAVLAYLVSPAVIGAFIIRWLQTQIKEVKADKEKREAEAKADKEKREKREFEYRRRVNDYQHAVAEHLFWVHKGIHEMDKEHKFFNGDFEASYKNVEEKEEALREFEQEIFIRQKY